MKQKLFDPQQWNMYAYGRNNPLRFKDPTGMYVCNGNECNQLKDALKAVEAAFKNKDLGSDARKDLKSVLKFYGPESKKAGDKGDNGVTVNTGKAAKGRLVGRRLQKERPQSTLILRRLAVRLVARSLPVWRRPRQWRTKESMGSGNSRTATSLRRPLFTPRSRTRIASNRTSIRGGRKIRSKDFGLWMGDSTRTELIFMR